MRYVPIGALAARFAGYPLVTLVADITPASDPANLERLAAGRVDILFAPAGAGGYDELAREADHYDV